MSRPGRRPGPLRGRTAEANELAQFLRDLTAEYTVSQLEQRYTGSRSVWSEYRSGQKIIPLSRLKQIIEDRFARDARTREQNLKEARRLYTAAISAAATAAASAPTSVTAAPETSPSPDASVSPGADEVPGSDPEKNPDNPLADEAAELSTDNPLTSTDDGPGPAADVSPKPEPVPGSDPDEPVVSRSLPGPGPRPSGRAKQLRRWRTPAQWAALAVLVGILVIANRPDHAKDPSTEASPPQSLGQESIGPDETPSPTPSKTPEASASAAPTPSQPEPGVSESAVTPSAKPTPSTEPKPTPSKSKAPQPAPPPPAVGSGPRTFVNAATQMCLEIRRSAGEDGATANQWTCNNSSSQKWLITNPTGSTNIVHIDSRKCLEIRGDVGDDGATANQWSCNHVPSSQVWRFQPVAGGGWMIVGAYSGKCLTIRGQGDGALASQWPCDNSASQTWY